MFSFIRYIGAIGFIAVLVGAFFIGIYFKSIALNHILVPTLEEQAKALSLSFNQNAWNKYSSQTPGQIPNTPSAGGATTTGNPVNRDFSYDSVLLLSSTPFLKFSLYNASGNGLFTFPQWSIGAKRDEAELKADFQKAISGNISKRVIENARYRSRDGTERLEGTLIRFMVPLSKDNNLSHTDTVAEIYYDISFAQPLLRKFQTFITAGSIMIVVALYIVIFIVYYRAELVIGKQHEANLELAEAKTRAEAESQEKSKFLANVSHELRTPLNAIIGFSDIIKDEVMGPIGNDQYREYIRDINQSGVHLLSLINDILDYSKAAAGKLEIDMVSVDLTKIIKSSLRLMLPRAEDAQVTLEEEIPKQHIVMTGDPKRLKQILLNLLSNAVKFTPEGGTVRLVAELNEENNRVSMIVQDTGIGIAPKDIAKAMATFGQVDSSLSRRYEGTGLGLPFTKKLVELMRGEFKLQSEIGIGTTVTVSFPLKQDLIVKPSPSLSTEPAAPHTSPELPTA